MNRWVRRTLTNKLNELLDGALPEAERQELERYIEDHPDARRELAHLKRVRAMLGRRTPLEPNIGFWTRLSAELEHRKTESGNLLPFPKRFAPVAAFSGVLGLVLVGVFLFQNRERLVAYVDRQSQSVKHVMTEGVMKGSLLPLFANVDKEQALQFGLFGTLPLDDKSETSLRIDERTKKGYRIEVTKRGKGTPDRLTMKEFLADVRPTASQRAIIDTLLDFARGRIERSVLLGENEAVAIDPTLPQLNKTLVSGIAACLEPDQRGRLGRMLEARDAPYTFQTKRSHAAQAEEVMRNVSEVPEAHHFVIVTPETLLLRQVLMDFGKMQREMARSLNMQAEVELRRARMIARFGTEAESAPNMPVPVFEGRQGPGVMRVEIERMTQQGIPEGLNVMITPRVRRHSASVNTTDESGLEFHFVDDSTGDIAPVPKMPRIRFYGRVPDQIHVAGSDPESGATVYELAPGGRNTRGEVVTKPEQRSAATSRVNTKTKQP